MGVRGRRPAAALFRIEGPNREDDVSMCQELAGEPWFRPLGYRLPATGSRWRKRQFAGWASG
jgi:hypothetical protein